MAPSSLVLHLLFPSLLHLLSSLAAAPPGTAPFSSTVLLQPVPGAPRAVSPTGWQTGKLCDITRPPYSAANNTVATEALQQAIHDCGNRPSPGGTVLIPAGTFLITGSLWLQSNLTLFVAKGAGLIGSMAVKDAPLTYTRRNSLMTQAHAGLLNAGRCLRLKDPLVGWDDCAEWSKVR